MYDKSIVALGISTLRESITKFDKKLSDNYIENFPIYGVKRYVYVVVIKELKRYSKIKDLNTFEAFRVSLELKYGDYIYEHSSVPDQVKVGINVMILQKILETIATSK